MLYYRPKIVRLLLTKGAPLGTSDNYGFDFLKFASKGKTRLSGNSLDEEAKENIKLLCRLLDHRPLVQGPSTIAASGVVWRKPTPPPTVCGLEACRAYQITACEFFFPSGEDDVNSDEVSKSLKHWQRNFEE